MHQVARGRILLLLVRRPRNCFLFFSSVNNSSATMRRERIDLVDHMFNQFEELIPSYSLEVHCQCFNVQKQHGPFEVSHVPVLHSGNFDHSHFHVELHLARSLFDPFQYESIYFLLVLHHDLKQIHFFSPTLRSYRGNLPLNALSVGTAKDVVSMPSQTGNACFFRKCCS